jgi:hypothetical protein
MKTISNYLESSKLLSVLRQTKNFEPLCLFRTSNTEHAGSIPRLSAQSLHVIAIQTPVFVTASLLPAQETIEIHASS